MCVCARSGNCLGSATSISQNTTPCVGHEVSSEQSHCSYSIKRTCCPNNCNNFGEKTPASYNVWDL